MRFLCLAYGDEKDWVALTKEQQDELLEADRVLLRRGALMGAVGPTTTVRAWERVPVTTDEPVAVTTPPLAGFSVIEARDIDEAIELVSRTPCAVARGAIEIRPILDL